MAQIDPQDEIRLLEYLQPHLLSERGWVNTELSAGDTQRQFNTQLPLSSHEQEMAALAKYLHEQLGIERVAASAELRPGQFYTATPLKESMARMMGDVMPYQILFHQNDRERVENFVSKRMQELREQGMVGSVSGKNEGIRK